MLALSPDLCLGIAIDGKLAASATAICYGRRLAWIGMVLTLPEYRGRGLARKLFAAILEQLRGMGIEAIKLDASEMGAGLYREFGFQDEEPVERWEREGAALELKAGEEYLGENAVWRSLARDGRMWSLEDGSFAIVRAGAQRGYVGPIVAGSRRAARELLRAVDGVGLYWDLLPEFGEARALAWYLGFRPVRRLMRMRLGAGARSERVFGIAGFEYG